MGKVVLSKASIEDLKKEIRRRQAMLPALVAQRGELDRKIAELQALSQVAPVATARKAAGVGAVRARGRRARNKLALPQLLIEILKAKPGQSVKELAKEALDGGYKTKSKKFESIVRQTLYHDKKRFKTVGRGRFAVKG